MTLYYYNYYSKKNFDNKIENNNNKKKKTCNFLTLVFYLFILYVSCVKIFFELIILRGKNADQPQIEPHRPHAR